MVKGQGWVCAVLGGRLCNMSALGRHIFLVKVVACVNFGCSVDCSIAIEL